MISNLLVSDDRLVDEISAPISHSTIDDQAVDEVSVTTANPVIVGKLDVIADVPNRMKSPHESAMSLRSCRGNASAPIDYQRLRQMRQRSSCSGCDMGQMIVTKRSLHFLVTDHEIQSKPLCCQN